MDNGAQYSESLARLRTRTIEQCLEAQRRTGRRLVFALDTALSLQGIELPRYRRGGLLADTLHAVIESNGVRTILQGDLFCALVWTSDAYADSSWSIAMHGFRDHMGHAGQSA